MNNISVTKQNGFLEESTSSDRLLKYYILIVTALITISYINILPREIQQIVTEEIPGVSGLLVKINDQYFQAVILINWIQLVFSVLSAVLAAIFVIWQRRLYEVLGILALGMIPKERKVWGVVRDKQNLYTIPFTQIRLLIQNEDNSKTQVEQAITDLDGRYRIQIKDKNAKYFLEVKASGYLPYNKEISFINTLITNNLIIDDILLEQDSEKESTLRSKLVGLRPKLYTFLIWFIFVSYLINIPIAIFATINNPILINWLFSITTIITTVWNVRIIKSRFNPNVGRLVDSEGKAILNLSVDLYDNNSKITNSKSNDKGEIKFDVAPGGYLIKPVTETNQNVFVPVRINPKGYLEKDVQLTGLSTKLSNNLLNPFGNIT